VSAILILLVVFVLMLVETLLSRRHERALRARGAIEPADDVYRLMAWAYPACFLAMGIEGLVRGTPRPALIVAGASVFVLGKAIKYWAIRSLGELWSFRVLVVPGVELVSRGPYRYMRHPNYVGLVGEMVGVALLTGAPIAGALAVIGFAELVRRRVVVEERALGMRTELGDRR
jgi:methyltransferase